MGSISAPVASDAQAALLGSGKTSARMELTSDDICVGTIRLRRSPCAGAAPGPVGQITESRRGPVMEPSSGLLVQVSGMLEIPHPQEVGLYRI